jgi:integrase
VPEYATGWERTTKRWVLNILGDKRAEDVTPADVRAVLSQPTKDRKGKAIANTTLVHDLPKTALKVRVMLEQVFTYAVGQDYRDEDKPNPAALTGKMIAFFGVRPRQSQAPHFAALDYRQAPAFMVELREERMGPAAHCLRFIGLTSVRTKEANGATWAEFDLDSALWTIPARRMKMRKEHVVPLSRQAVDLLRGMIPGTQDEFVFPSPKDGGVLSPNAMLMLLKRMKRHGAMTPHGMRACFRTWAAEQTNYASEVAEACLAHYSGSATELAYQRGTFLEKRRQLMIAWADYLDRLPISATVTPIGAARSAS